MTLKAESSIPRCRARVRGLAAEHPYRVLTAVYLLSVFVQFAILFYTGVIPSIMADEMLYMQLAKSLYAGEGAALRGQPIVYRYILYPLFIAPLYALPRSVNIYQAVFCLNNIVINLAIFPAYRLAEALTKNKGAALLIAILTALMPDMLMAKHIMTESLAFPLMLTAFLLAYRLLETPRKKSRAYLLGALCFALYLLKPGYIGLCVACAGVMIIFGLVSKNRILVRNGVIIAAVAAALVLLYRVFSVYALGIDYSFQATYRAQAGTLSLEHIWQTLVGGFKYLAYTGIAFGLLPFVRLLSGLRRGKSENKLFAWIILASLIIILLGTAYVVNWDEFVKTGGVPTRVHIRYVFFFLPALLTLLFSDEPEKRKPCWWQPALIAGIAVAGVLCFPPSGFSGSARYTTDSTLLSAFLMQNGAWDGLVAYLPVFFALTLPLLFLSWRKGLTKRLCYAFIGLMAMLLLANHAAMAYSDQYAMNTPLNADAAACDYLTDGDALYVCKDGGEQGYDVIALEVNSRCDIKPVTLSAMLDNTDADGAISSVMPYALSDHLFTNAVNPYPRPRYLVLDSSLLYSLRLSDSASIIALTKNGSYQVVELPESGEWLHSAINGLNEGWVWENTRLTVCDKWLRENRQITLWLKTRAGVDGAKLTVEGPGEQRFSFAPSAETETQWISMTFAVSDSSAPLSFALTHENGNIYIETYAVE
ncbi:MAG: hypothetical protein PHI27_10380 [Eubacteriales bacterium]|nr:hypothetical protein [Eubacteriales bacterium]MDD3882647.1 hypothetical protein [Eubacteriales bacterium]MDD4512781.1 hypothetical protein [Eubacteriales bacterium]